MFGRLAFAVKFSELPKPLTVRSGVKIGIATGERIVTTVLSTTAWQQLEQDTKIYPRWVATLSGSPEQITEGEISLRQSTVQVVVKKTKAEKVPDQSTVAPSQPAKTSPLPAASTVNPRPTDSPPPPAASTVNPRPTDSPPPPTALTVNPRRTDSPPLPAALTPGPRANEPPPPPVPDSVHVDPNAFRPTLTLKGKRTKTG